MFNQGGNCTLWLGRYELIVYHNTDAFERVYIIDDIFYSPLTEQLKSNLFGLLHLSYKFPDSTFTKTVTGYYQLLPGQSIILVNPLIYIVVEVV